ncbi:MAG TPA: tRNA threonylcarbamoyladenosine dehydratase [Eggerthellaceae bacterium]|nr:tRNA threonylcarbamoyladenosine dehydratase [Eggerthellaceae bacterium]
MLNRFSRTELLLGEDGMRALERARVAVFGVGGVGGYAVEALARSGVGAIDVVDHDRVSPTNVNRQVVALESTIGQFKAQVMAARIRDINPACRATAHICFFLPDTADQVDLSQFDYIVDAVDTVTAKLLLAERAQKAGVPIISSMGTANKLDPTALEVADISETSICPLAKIIRKECRKRGIEGLKVVYSKEPASPPSDQAMQRYLHDAADADPSVIDRFGRAGVPGSTAFVPPAAGLILASEVVKDLVRKG